MQPTRVDNLLLDLGNVLVGVDPTRTLREFSRLVGRNIGETETSFDPLLATNERFDAGAIDAAGFRSSICRQLGAEISDADFDAAWCAMIVLLPPTTQLVAELARHQRLIMLSNTDPIHFADVRNRCADWLPYFRGLFLSYEACVAKPEPAFFDRALDRFELDPASCLFLDDRAENVDSARSVGIASQRVTTFGLERTALVEWGLLPARQRAPT